MNAAQKFLKGRKFDLNGIDEAAYERIAKAMGWDGEDVEVEEEVEKSQRDFGFTKAELDQLGGLFKSLQQHQTPELPDRFSPPREAVGGLVKSGNSADVSGLLKSLVDANANAHDDARNAYEVLAGQIAETRELVERIGLYVVQGNGLAKSMAAENATLRQSVADLTERLNKALGAPAAAPMAKSVSAKPVARFEGAADAPAGEPEPKTATAAEIKGLLLKSMQGTKDEGERQRLQGVYAKVTGGADLTEGDKQIILALARK